MNKRQFLLVLLMSFLGGIVGGALSNQYFSKLAYSKNEVKDPVKDTIDAKMFRVIDDEGGVYCTLGFKNGLEFSKRQDIITKIDPWGLETTKEIKGGMLKTRIWPWGFFYHNYSAWEVENQKNNLFGFSPDDSLIQMGGDINDGPSLIIRDKSPGKSFPTDRAVLGKVVLTNKNEERITRPASSLVLFGERGNVLFSAP